jgi:hypothetical protein
MLSQLIIILVSLGIVLIRIAFLLVGPSIIAFGLLLVLAVSGHGFMVALYPPLAVILIFCLGLLFAVVGALFLQITNKN